EVREVLGRKVHRDVRGDPRPLARAGRHVQEHLVAVVHPASEEDDPVVAVGVDVEAVVRLPVFHSDRGDARKRGRSGPLIRVGLEVASGGGKAERDAEDESAGKGHHLIPSTAVSSRETVAFPVILGDDTTLDSVFFPTLWLWLPPYSKTSTPRRSSSSTMTTAYGGSAWRCCSPAASARWGRHRWARGSGRSTSDGRTQSCSTCGFLTAPASTCSANCSDAAPPPP